MAKKNYKIDINISEEYENKIQELKKFFGYKTKSKVILKLIDESYKRYIGEK